MKRMSLYKMICYCCLIWGTMACTKEDTPEAMWEYTGPVPAILDGPSQAQKMCYALYQKYDLHIYYNLSGEEALKTEVGYTQVNGITANNPEAIPMQAADEAVAEKFLTLLTGFFALLPDEMVSSGLYRRQVLVKINPGNNKYKDENGNRIFSNTKTEEMQGILYYGYLDNSQDTDDKFTDGNGGFFMSSSGVCLIPLTKVFRCRNVLEQSPKDYITMKMKQMKMFVWTIRIIITGKSEKNAGLSLLSGLLSPAIMLMQTGFLLSPGS